MNIRVFANFLIVAGILFQLWGISGCMNHGASMGTYENIHANEKAGNRNFLIGTGLVFIAVAMKVSARKSQTRRTSGSEGQIEDNIRWTCSCGNENSFSDNFCPRCGNPKTSAIWKCPCGHVSMTHGEFCAKCGEKKTPPV